MRIDIFTKIIYWSVILSICLSPLTGYEKEFLWSKVAVFNTGLFFACLAALADLCTSPSDKKIDLPLLSAPIAALLLFTLFSSIFIAENPYQSVSIIIVSGGNIALYFVLTMFLNDRQKGERIFFPLLLTCVAVSVYGIMQYYKVMPLPKEFYGENDPGATFFRTNQAAQFLVALLPYFIVRSVSELFNSSKFFKKIFWPVCTGIILYYFFIARSRGSWIGLFAASMFMFAVFLKKKGLGERWKGVAAVALFFFFILFFTTPVRDALRSFSLKDPPVYFRFLAWKSSLNMIKDNIMLGVGVGNFATLFPKYQVPALEVMKLKEGSRVIFAHNDFLQIMAEYGVIGLLPFIWMGSVVAGMCGRRLKESFGVDELMRNLGITGGIIALLVHACFSYNLQFPVPVACMVILIWLLETGESRKDMGKKRFISVLVFMMCCCFTLYSVVYAGSRTLAEIARADGIQAKKHLSVKESIRFFNNSLKLYPYNDSVYFQLGLAHKRLGRWELAINDFKRSIRFYPYNGKAYQQIGILYTRMKKFDKAKENFQKALELTPALKGAISY